MASFSVRAQEIDRDSSVRFFGVPLIFYSSDTKWGFGAGGVVTFRGYKLRSSVTFSLTYTQRKQWQVQFPFVWFSRGGDWRTYGEVAWYHYSYRYFGTGNSYPNEYIENYKAEYPRLRLTATRSINRKQSAGIRLYMDAYQITEKEPGGEIDRDEVAGSDGGFSSGLGAVWLFDSRDNQFFPHEGWYVETTLTGEHPLTLSAFRYLRFLMDASRYQAFGNKWVLATQFYAQFTAGRAPFFQLPSLGGSRRLRGYPDFKYRDRHLLLLQTELRFPIVWRFKGVVFAAAGSVFGTPGERMHWRPNGGVGLRVEFDRKQRQHLRMDYGWGEFPGNSGFYLTFGEAF
jgi:outer membrane protein assembly factor BamA